MPRMHRLDRNVPAQERSIDAPTAIEANRELQLIELAALDVLNRKAVQDVLVVPPPESELMNAAESKADEHVVTQNEMAVRPHLLGHLEGMHIGEHAGSAGGRRCSDEFQSDHFGIMERWPATEHARQEIRSPDAKW